MTREVVEVLAGKPEQIEDFKNAPIQKQRFLAFAHKISNLTTIVKYETEEKLCWFIEASKVRFGTKGFIQRKAEDGFTYNKETRKLSTWFGTNMRTIPQSLFSVIVKDIKQEWYNDMSHRLRHVITRAMLERMIKGRITNPRDYVKAYINTSLRIKGISPEKYYKFFNKKESGYGLAEVDCAVINQILRFAKNPNWVLDNISKIDKKLGDSLVTDIINECKILDKKFDWSWSETRAKLEHTFMSREIRGLELEYIEDKTIEYKGELTLPDGWTLINNQKRLFIEGSEMDHCVYHYWHNVEGKNQFIISIDDGCNRVTAAIASYGYLTNKDDLKWRLSQIYAKRNTPCPDELRAAVELWLKQPYVQKFFELQNASKSTAGGEVMLRQAQQVVEIL